MTEAERAELDRFCAETQAEARLLLAGHLGRTTKRKLRNLERTLAELREQSPKD